MRKSIVLIGLALLGAAMLAPTQDAALGIAHAASAAGGPGKDGLQMARRVRVAEGTMHSIGFEWDILPPGDTDHSATALVCYRKAKGADTWKSARLLRVNYQGWYRRCCEGEGLCMGSCHACDANCDPCLIAPDVRCAAQGEPNRCDPGENCRDPRCPAACEVEPISCADGFDICRTGVHGYRHFDMFAGSVMFLDPGTKYQVKLLAFDPPDPGTNAAAECSKTHSAAVRKRSFRVKTLAPPQPGPGKARYVGPDLGGGCDLNDPNYCKVCGTKASPIPGFAAAEACVKKGYDRFLVLPGDYYGHTFTESGRKRRYIAWTGAAGTVATPPGPGPPIPCPSAAQESPYPLTPIVLHARDAAHPATLIVSADRLWFEGLDLRPEQPGAAEGIVATMRPPLWPTSKCAALAGQPGRKRAFGEHCDWRGVQDLVIKGNAFTDFASAIAAGRWCTENNEFKTVLWRADHLSLAGTAGSDKPCSDQPQDWWGEPWGGPPTDPESERNLDRRRAVMHRHWYVADNVIRYDNEDQAPNEGMYLSFLADSDIAYNRISLTPCKHPADMAWPGLPEPDAMTMFSSTNVDVYGNDIRDITDNGIHASWTYANLRVWRNRAINTGNAFLNFDPMGGAPWYVVRNEVIPQAGHHPFQANVFDRLFLANNTFIARGGLHIEAVEPNRADLLLRSVARDNLWMLRYENTVPPSTPSAMLWRGHSGVFAGSTFVMAGQTRCNWRTNVDYDGMDWDTLPDVLGDAGIINWGDLWHDGLSWGRLTLLAPGTEQRSFQKLSRGCAGGPRDGLYCESDADCASAGIAPSYPVDPTAEADFAAPDPSAPFKCIAAERNYRRVHRATAFGGATATRDQVDARIDQYAAERYSPDRLDLECDPADPPNDCQGEGGCCPVDRGDAAFHADNAFLWRDIVAGRSQPYVTDGKPDLGAYERGQAAPQYGPRAP